MKRLVQITTIFMILPILGFCQNEFSIGVNLNKEINLLTFKDSPSHEGELGFGYSIGIQAHYDLGKKTFLRSGINYQNNKYLSTYRVRWSSGNIASAQDDITIASIGIPIDFGYIIKSKSQKINYLIGFGGLINLNLVDKTEVQGIGDERTFKNEMRKSSYSIGAFGGLEIQLDDKIILGIEPNFRYGSNVFTSLLPKARTTEYGITLRIRGK